MKKLTLHPACRLFPQLGKEKLQQLAADIKANGLLNPIVLYMGQILDGRNRYLACRIAKVKPRFVEWDGEGSPTEWVISENLIRRHLTASQRAVIAFDLLPLLEEEAKERQRLSNGRGKKVDKELATLSGKASSVAARIAKTNSTYVEAVKSVSKAAPELVEIIRAGELGILDAQMVARLPRRERRGVLKQIGAGEHVNGYVKTRVAEILGIYDSADRGIRNVSRLPKIVSSPDERKERVAATMLFCGDNRKILPTIPNASVDLFFSDPPYPEINKKYGCMSEKEWLDFMRSVVQEGKRILKPMGSAVFILQPNYENLGHMRLWAYDFVSWAGREMGLVADAYWWCMTAPPTAATHRTRGLLRQSVKWCVWLGPSNCYRNQDAVLWEPSDGIKAQRWSERCLVNQPSGHTIRRGRIAQTAAERGGVTPFNLLPIPNEITSAKGDHPATTPYEVAAWWCRYLLPPQGVLLDCCCGTGTMLLAGLNCGASKVIGIDKERKYIAIAKRRIANGHT
jgi:16S rRNA G966 N2-methylase RsmD